MRRWPLFAALAIAALLAVALWLRSGHEPGPEPAEPPCSYLLSPGPDGCTLTVWGPGRATSRVECGRRLQVCGQQLHCECIPPAKSADPLRIDAGVAAPPLHSSPPEVEGGRAADVAEVERAVEALRPLVQQCFEDAHHLEGEVTATVGFTVLTDQGEGRLGKPVVDASTSDPYVRACLEDSVEEVRFTSGRPPAPIRARQHFIYTPPRP